MNWRALDHSGITAKGTTFYKITVSVRSEVWNFLSKGEKTRVKKAPKTCKQSQGNVRVTVCFSVQWMGFGKEEYSLPSPGQIQCKHRDYGI